MEPKEYEKMYEAETSYFWFLGKHRLLLSIIRDLLKDRKSPAILDIGCGTGGFLKHATPMGNAVGLDWDKGALSFCRSRGLNKLILADWNFPPIREESFDAVVASDFIEHLEDDVGALRSMYSVLKKGGILLITVPAHPWLFSSHDLALKHKRRYSRPMLDKALKTAGVPQARLFYWGGVLLPFMIPVRMAQRFFVEKESESKNYETIKYKVPKILNDFFTGLLNFELRRIRGNKAMKIGSSLVAVAVKR